MLKVVKIFQWLLLLVFFSQAWPALAKADMIVALGGGDDRKIKAVELFHKGEAKTLLFTGEEHPKEIYAHWKVQGIIPDHVAKDTPDDFRVIRHEMTKRHFTSVIVVDSDYHLPASTTFAKQILPKSYTVRFVSVATNAPLSKRVDVILGTIRRTVIKQKK